MSPTDSIGASVEVVGLTPLDPSVTLPAIVKDALGGGTRPIPNVGDGNTAGAGLVKEMAAAAEWPDTALGDSSAESNQHTMPTIIAHAPAVIASHKTSPARLGRRLPAIEIASVGMTHSCVVAFGPKHWRVN